MTAMMLSSVPGMTYALETVSSDADIYEAELTKVSVARSVEELSRKSEAADNEAFFTIDAAKDDTAGELASEEVAESVNDILSEDISASDKQELVADTLEDSGFYRAVEGSGSKVEVTSKFAFQRLRLIADKQKEINAYGAARAVFYKDHYLLSYDSEESTKAAYDALVSEYGSSSVLVDQPVKAEAAAKGWGTNYMKMDHEKIIAAKGRDVTVAVLDTGIKRDHEVFSGRTVLRGYDFVNSDEDPSDDHGHGTAVSGIIAESTPSNVKILPVKALKKDEDTLGATGSVEDVMMALEYAEREHADIINMSLAGLVEDDEMKERGEELGKCSALVVCAAGNGEKLNDRKEYDMDLEGYNEFPAEIESTVCVGSIRRTGGTRSSFSNYGQALDFTAPGESVHVAGISGSYTYKSGTSFATPYIAGAAALVMAENSEFDNEAVVNYLISISDDPGDEGWDKYYGNGCPIFPETDDGQQGGISGKEADTAYSGGDTADFTVAEAVKSSIALKAAKIKKPVKARRAITVKWQKQSGKTAGRRITGYQVQVAADREFTQDVKTAKVKGYKKTSKKMTKLLPKTKYFTRVRTYMKYGGKTYYSAWSRIRSTKTR